MAYFGHFSLVQVYTFELKSFQFEVMLVEWGPRLGNSELSRPCPVSLSAAQCPVSCSLTAPPSAGLPPQRSHWPAGRPIRSPARFSKEPPADQTGDREVQWPVSAATIYMYICQVAVTEGPGHIHVYLSSGLSPRAVCLTLTPHWHYCTSVFCSFFGCSR